MQVYSRRPSAFQQASLPLSPTQALSFRDMHQFLIRQLNPWQASLFLPLSTSSYRRVLPILKSSLNNYHEPAEQTEWPSAGWQRAGQESFDFQYPDDPAGPSRDR